MLPEIWFGWLREVVGRWGRSEVLSQSGFEHQAATPALHCLGEKQPFTGILLEIVSHFGADAFVCSLFAEIFLCAFQ